MVVGQGSSQKLFLVHKDLVTRHSDFFSAALSKDWKENKTRSVTLEEDDPATFEIFSRFLYSGQIFIVADAGDGSATKPKTLGAGGYNEEWNRLTQCWCLGDKLLSSSFKDAITDTAIARLLTTKKFPLSMPQEVYQASSGDSGMRRLMRDVVVWRWDDYHLSSRFRPDDSIEFYVDVAVTMKKVSEAQRSGDPPYAAKSTCGYHDHNGACYKSMF